QDRSSAGRLTHPCSWNRLKAGEDAVGPVRSRLWSQGAAPSSAPGEDQSGAPARPEDAPARQGPLWLTVRREPPWFPAAWPRATHTSSRALRRAAAVAASSEGPSFCGDALGAASWYQRRRD
uniref:Uncharacterized protein n=1 Tax=Mustela putorius furo TaxID=9669 RepID=M3YP18_MUSPF